MGSLFFNQGSMDKNYFTQKRHTSYLDTPRNSKKLQIDASQGYYAVGEVQYNYQVEMEHSDQNFYSNEASMKKLIDKEMSKHSNLSKNTPNIVARLMGMDLMPSDMKPENQLREKTKQGNFLCKERIQRCPDGPILSHLDSSMQMGPSYHNWERESNQWNRSHKMANPRRREHPQEEELQKFKKEFEAYQAARIRECSRVLEVGSSNKQLLSQEDHAKVQMAATAISRRLAAQKPVKPKNSILELRSLGQSNLKDHSNKMDVPPVVNRQSFPMRNKSNHVDIDHSLISSDKKMKSSSPSRIVILKPGPDRICHLKESCVSASGAFGERTNIEDFLEEVKERLKWELHGKANQMASGVRGSGIETPYSEKPSFSKHIARHFEQHAREGVNKEIGINLIRSESTRSCRSDTQLNGPNSSEFLNLNSGRLLSARLQNIENKDEAMNGRDLTLAVLHDESGVTKRAKDIMRGERDSIYLEIERDEEEVQTRSFRHGARENEVVHRELSPGNLTRSFSAPVSGTSFGKLLLEDRNILTGAHIRRKHEDNENVSTKMKVPKKEKFNLKEKVSNFRYSFTLRRKLFGKKTQSTVESLKTETSPLKDLMSGPTVLLKTRERQTRENSTEVPPSPASVYSSTADEPWGPSDHLSRLSTSDVTPGDDIAGPQVFREISSNLNELQRQLHNLESNEFENTAELLPEEFELVDEEDHEEGNIEQLLVASGLAEKYLSRWETLSSPISNSVFEEAYKKLVKENTNNWKDKNGKVDHRLLLDLLNEAVSTTLATSSRISGFRGFNTSSTVAPFFGPKLLDSAWDVIHAYIHPPANRSSYYSLDCMVGQDLNSTHWPPLMNGESYIAGRDIESLITRDLLAEIVYEIQV